jgi:hypothetical protein
VSCAMRRRGPPQCGQVRTSTAKTRRSSSAQVERDERGRAEVLGAVGELGARAPGEWVGTRRLCTPWAPSTTTREAPCLWRRSTRPTRGPRRRRCQPSLLAWASPP